MDSPRALTGSPTPYPRADAASTRGAASWDCRHARNELVQAVADVYVGFGTMAATSETGVGALVGAGLTIAAVGDTIVKGDAADHACATGRYASPP